MIENDKTHCLNPSVYDMQYDIWLDYIISLNILVYVILHVLFN